MLKRILFFAFIILALALMTPILSSAEQDPITPAPAGPEVVKGEIIVKFKPGVSDVQKTEVAKSEDAVIKESLLEPDSKVMKVDETTDTVKAVTDLNNRPEVVYAEQNAIVKAEMVPNDPLNKYQWHFNAINMPTAWDMADGQGTIVAVIDTGVAYEDYGGFHKLSDLAGTSFTGGWNFVNNTPHANDDHGHGSHVTGTIAQSTNNNFGVSGIAYRSTIMPVKVLNSNGSGTTAAVADGIRWSADRGAKVINLSLGSSSPSQTMKDAVDYARNTKNVVVVAAAGNGARSGLIYPAAYDSVISVAATDYNNNLTWYSQYGPGLDISAPGGDTGVDRNGDGQHDGVLQQTIGSGNPATEGFYQYQGTSMATPHVSGVAALLVAKGVTSATQIQQILSSTAKDLGQSGYDTTYGNGLLDAAAAIRTQSTDGSVPVYRFWSDSKQEHFYTIDSQERDHVMATWPTIWSYEGIAFYTYPTAEPNTSPVYRFWSDSKQGHFYTIDSQERDHVMATWPTIWSYENVAFNAYTTPATGTSPVYRFWSESKQHHFYTISLAERDHVIATWPTIWSYEGIAYYAKN